MNKKSVWLLCTVIVLLAASLGYVLYNNSQSTDDDTDDKQTTGITSFAECVAAGYPVMESYPRQCAVPGNGTFTEVIENQQYEYTSDGGVNILLDNFASGKSVSSPLTVTGEVPGNWSFEASFPVKLIEKGGVVIAQATATLTEDWMTEENVPFTVTLEFGQLIDTTDMILVLEKDNPSGLAENGDSVEVPVVYE